MTAALSEYATTVPRGCARCVARIIANRLLLLRHAVDDPVGIEDLVPAMLGVRLREHHELDVGRIAAQRAKARVEVLDLVGRQRETEFDVGRFERARPSPRSGMVVSGRGATCANSRAASATSSNTASIIRSCKSGSSAARSPATSGCAVASRHAIHDAALDARDRRQPAVARDVGRLRRPGRDRARARNDEQIACRSRAYRVAASGPYVSRRSSVVRSNAASGRRSSTKCQYVAAMPATRWTE